MKPSRWFSEIWLRRQIRHAEDEAKAENYIGRQARKNEIFFQARVIKLTKQLAAMNDVKFNTLEPVVFDKK